jgi:hypothetical protein
VWLSRFLTVPRKSLCTCDAIGHVESAEELWARGEQIARERNLEYYRSQVIPAEMWNALGEYRQRHRVHFDAIVPYNLLGDALAMKGLWKLALPGVAWNQARFEAFSRKKITCEKPTLTLDRFEKLAAFLGREVERV